MDLSNEMRVVGEVAIAAVLGGALGLERELAGKSAGMRTQMFVAAVAALMVALGPMMVAQMHDALPGDQTVRSDPLRIMEAIITGVSFLGAGMIVFHKSDNHLEGLTTAASTLMVAGIGMAVALHRVLLAVLLTAFTLLVTLGLGVIERRLPRPKRDQTKAQTSEGTERSRDGAGEQPADGIPKKAP